MSERSIFTVSIAEGRIAFDEAYVEQVLRGSHDDYGESPTHERPFGNDVTQRADNNYRREQGSEIRRHRQPIEVAHLLG